MTIFIDKTSIFFQLRWTKNTNLQYGKIYKIATFAIKKTFLIIKYSFYEPKILY